VSNPQTALSAILEKREVRLSLKEALLQRLSYSSEKEQRQSEALFNRALHPQCSFDRENQLMLYALAFSANQGLEFQTSGEIAPPFSQALNSYEIEN
jgi:hypothetical protein